MNSKQIINGCLLPLTIIIVLGFCAIMVMVLGQGLPNLRTTPQPFTQATPPPIPKPRPTQPPPILGQAQPPPGLLTNM